MLKKSWNYNEKEFLAHLFTEMGEKDYLWRDDAVITPINEELALLYSIDNAEKIYFSEDRGRDMRCYGRWAAAVISNDILACGVLPRGLAIDMGIKDKSEEDCRAFIKGVLDVCVYYGMKYEGGNINTTDSVSGLAWGCALNEQIIRREGAQAGDILLATCEIGKGWSDRLLREAGMNSRLEKYKEFPVVNIELFEKIWRMGVIHCGMDLTDGIIEFGYEINDRSGMGVVFDMDYERSEFLSEAAAILNIPSIALRFEPGYDTPYAHGWCVAPESLKMICEVFQEYGATYTILGYVDGERNDVVLKTEGKWICLPRYWDDKIQNKGSVEKWYQQILELWK